MRTFTNIYIDSEADVRSTAINTIEGDGIELVDSRVAGNSVLIRLPVNLQGRVAVIDKIVAELEPIRRAAYQALTYTADDERQSHGPGCPARGGLGDCDETPEQRLAHAAGR